MKTTKELFVEVELKKLKSQFGDKSFSGDKANILWNDLKHLKYETIARIIDELISGQRFTPIAKDWRELIAVNREETHQQEAKNRFHELNRNFKPEEQKRIFVAILECIEKNNLERLDKINRAIVPAIRSCLKCGGDGIVIGIDSKNYEYAFKCDCQACRESLNSFPSWGTINSMGMKLKFQLEVKAA